jgi:hypothetical protein
MGTVAGVRNLIPDTDGTDPIFPDTQLQYFLDVSNQNEMLAAALALETAASNEVLLYKVMQVGPDRIDAASGARVLLERAARLREQATALQQYAVFGVIEQAHGVFGWRERLWNEWLRNAR